MILSRDDLSVVGWWTQLAGTVGLSTAVLSGLLAASSAQIPAGALVTLQNHQEMAFLSAAIFFILLFWRISTRTRVPSKGRGWFLIVLAAGVGVLISGAWFGGELVFRSGVGVGGK